MAVAEEAAAAASIEEAGEEEAGVERQRPHNSSPQRLNQCISRNRLPRQRRLQLRPQKQEPGFAARDAHNRIIRSGRRVGKSRGYAAVRSR